MTDSILESVKKLLGYDSEYTAFDPDIMLHINAAFSTLRQLGLGPAEGFSIADNNSKWQDFVGTNKTIESVKIYVYLKVRLLFDPPATSFAIAAFEKQASELEWRLNVEMENLEYPYRGAPLYALEEGACA